MNYGCHVLWWSMERSKLYAFSRVEISTKLISIRNYLSWIFCEELRRRRTHSNTTWAIYHGIRVTRSQGCDAVVDARLYKLQNFETIYFYQIWAIVLAGCKLHPPPLLPSIGVIFAMHCPVHNIPAVASRARCDSSSHHVNQRGLLRSYISTTLSIVVMT